MNYRHAYHAGNFADVLKHAALSLVIEHLKKKETPFRVIDTHAGTGRYDLFSLEANKTQEWHFGIGKILEADLPDDLAVILSPYLSAVRNCNAGNNTLTHYPGSPLLAKMLVRTQDRIIANELHPVDVEQLRTLFAKDKQVKVTALDGWTALKAFLPPKERRGVVLIDPPFEEAGERERLVAALKDCVRRFATGTVLLWYPIKALPPINAMLLQIADLKIPNVLNAKLFLKAPEDPQTLNGTGLVLLNPPFECDEKLRTLLPFLSERLGQHRSASWSLEWLTTKT